MGCKLLNSSPTRTHARFIKTEHNPYGRSVPPKPSALPLTSDTPYL